MMDGVVDMPWLSVRRGLRCVVMAATMWLTWVLKVMGRCKVEVGRFTGALLLREVEVMNSRILSA